MAMVPTPTNPGMTSEEALYRGAALAQLRILKQQMQLGGLSQGKRSITLSNGIQVFCNICGNKEDVYVRIPEVHKQADILHNDNKVYGFVFIPRSGNVKEDIFISDNGDKIPYYYIDSIGFDDKGVEFITDENHHFPYPVNQSYPNYKKPFASKRLSKHNADNAKWMYFTNIGFSYGNTDWIGNYTGDYTPTLSWLGSPSRYFDRNPIISNRLFYNDFSSDIYSRGEVLATLPCAIKLPITDSTPYPYEQVLTEDGETIPYNVLGAAITKGSSGYWLLAVCRWYKIVPKGESIAVYNFFSVIATQDYKNISFYHKKLNPKGWRFLYYVLESDDYALNSELNFMNSWFFNQDGNKACSVKDNILYTISINIDSLSATLKKETYSKPGIVKTTGSSYHTSSGEITQVPYNYRSSGTDTGSKIHYHSERLIAADWKDNELVTAVVSFESALNGVTQTTHNESGASISDECNYSTGSEVEIDTDTSFSVNGSYSWNLTAGDSVYNIGTGSMTSLKKFKGYKFTKELSVIDAPVWFVSGPADVAVSSTYTASSSLIRPITWSMIGGTITANSSDGGQSATVNSVVRTCPTPGMFGTITATDKCGHTASMPVNLAPTNAVWRRTSCQAWYYYPNQPKTCDDYGIYATSLPTASSFLKLLSSTPTQQIWEASSRYCFNIYTGDSVICGQGTSTDISTWGPIRDIDTDYTMSGSCWNNGVQYFWSKETICAVVRMAYAVYDKVCA